MCFICAKKKEKKCVSSVTQTTVCRAVQQLLHCALRWNDCDITPLQLSRFEGGARLCDRATHAPAALCTALCIALT